MARCELGEELLRLLTLLALLLLLGCAGAQHHDTNTGRFLIDDTRIIPPSLTVGHGFVNVMVGNRGSQTHDLILVHAPAGALPRKPDGSVDESQLDVVFDSGPIAYNKLVGPRPLELAAGKYLAFSNIGGDFSRGYLTVWTIS